jgi:hypothetical protein
MSSGDVYQKLFADIAKYCKRYSCSQAKTRKSVRDPINRITKPTPGGVTKIKLGNLLENFKTNILNTIISQLDTIKIKRKQQEENATLAIFCPWCRKRHLVWNVLLMLSKYMASVQNITLPMSALLYLD